MSKCPFRYSTLVAAYYDESVRCLEARCFLAAIGVLWAATDYAIEHQLWGGTVVDPQTLDYVRPSIRFKPQDFKGKLRKFFERFASLRRPWEDKLQDLYDLYRNTFLHARLENLVEKRVGEESDPAFIQIEKSKTPLPRQRRTTAEVLLIGRAEHAARDMFDQVTDFLKNLNARVNP